MVTATNEMHRYEFNASLNDISWLGATFAVSGDIYFVGGPKKCVMSNDDTRAGLQATHQFKERGGFNFLVVRPKEHRNESEQCFLYIDGTAEPKQLGELFEWFKATGIGPRRLK